MTAPLLAGRYRILSPLGAGGMGEALLAEDTRLERRVAVKLLSASIEADTVARERLRRQALAATALDHPFIGKVYEIGDSDGRVCLVMEYVEGETLQAAARRALLPVKHVLDIAHELTQALDAAHRRRLVHREARQRDGDAAGPREGDGFRTQPRSPTPARGSVRRPTGHRSRCWVRRVPTTNSIAGGGTGITSGHRPDPKQLSYPSSMNFATKGYACDRWPDC